METYTEQELLSFGRYLVDQFVMKIKYANICLNEIDIHNWKDSTEYKLLQQKKLRKQKLNKLLYK